MISLTTTSNSFNCTPEDIISTLRWKIYPTNKIILATNSISVDTTKPLIGYIDNDYFILARSRPIYKMLLPVMTVVGHLTSDNGKTILTVKYKPSILSSACLAFFIYAGISLVLDTFKSNYNSETIIDLLIWLILFPGMGLALVIREGNITKDIIIDTLRIIDTRDKELN